MQGLEREDLKDLFKEILGTYSGSGNINDALYEIRNGNFANVLYYWMTHTGNHGFVNLDRFNINSRDVNEIINYINSELGTTLTNNVADADKAKYCICAKLYNPKWSQPVKRYLNSKYWPFDGVEITDKKTCLIGFETEADAQDCLNKLSSITSRNTYKDAEWIIEPIKRSWTDCHYFIKAKVNLQGKGKNNVSLLGEYYLPLDVLCRTNDTMQSYEDTFGELFR